MGDVLEYLIDGVSGLSPGDVDGTIMVAGVCSLGTVGQGYLLGPSSDLEGLLGVGPLVDRLQDIFATAGQDAVIIAVPVEASVAGAIGEVTHTGTGPDVTTGGTAKADADVEIEIVTGGALNVGTYQLTVDGGDNWSTEKTIPADGAIAIGTTGVTVTVADTSDSVAGDTYTLTISAPTATITNVMTAIEQPLDLYDVEGVYVCGASDATDWAAMGSKADTLWNAHKPTYFIAETRLPGDEEALDTWVAAMLSEVASYNHRFVTVCAAFGEIVDASGRSLARNWAGLMTGRILSIPVMRAIGRVRDGGISQGTLPEKFTSAMQKQLETAGFVTAKYYAGLTSPYWGDAKTLAEVTSDYRYIEVLRTVFKAVRKERIAALKSQYDEAGDPLIEGGAAGLIFLQANIEGGLNTMVAEVPPELAGHVVSIPDGQDIVNNGVAVVTDLIGIPIIRNIKLYSRYIYAGSSFDPRME